MNKDAIQQMTPQELLEAYIATDKVCRENDGEQSLQRRRLKIDIFNRLYDDLGYCVDYCYENNDYTSDVIDYSRYHLAKRQGYWGSPSRRWEGDVIVEGWR